MKRIFNLLLLGLVTVTAYAQLSTNPDKFLGNITTYGSVDSDGQTFHLLWNQITPENESKWDAIEGNRGTFTFGGADRSATYAREHGFIFKYHTLIWGGQYPRWMDNLSTSEQYQEIVKYFNAVKEHYPNLEIIDVVNEAIAGHAPAPYRAALGGEGKTGYDWIIKAFEMAHERWPDAILVYNDFNTFRWQKSEFIDLVRTIRDAGAPVDAYGCQSHDLTDCGYEEFTRAMDEIQDALKMPMYSTEYDIGTNDDNLQAQRYREQIPYMWEKDYCAGITLWGYIYGKTWTGKEEDGTKGNSGLIRNGEDRPAMTWLRQYMASDAAKQAKSPFPGMKKEASVYVKPQTLSATINEPLTVTVNARLRTKTIASVKLYVKNQLYATLTEAPYEIMYTPAQAGKYDLKAVVEATDGSTYERLSSFTAYKAREPFNGVIDLPGTIEGENFDSGAEGMAYHDSDSQNQGSGKSYRADAGSVDIESFGNGGYAIGWTHAGEWLEYTVNVKEAGLYEFDAYLASQDGGGSFSLALSGADGLTDLTGEISVLKTGNWGTYNIQSGRFIKELAEGQQVLRLIVRSGDLLFNIDKIVLRHLDASDLRKPYKNVSLPGTLQFEDFDWGIEGLSFHDSDATNEGTAAYRADGGGVDIVAGNGNYAIGYTATDEWLEYTVDVKESGMYTFEAAVSSGIEGVSSFSLSLNDNGTLTALTNTVDVPSMGENDWDTYGTVAGDLLIPLEKGKHIIRMTVTGPYCNLDKISFALKSLPGDIHVDGVIDEQDIADLTDIVLNGSQTEEPVDLGHTPYREMELPGTIEAEDFDCDGEGISYHDDEEEDKGKVGYRPDNGGVDIVGGAPGGSYAIGYTPAGEWLEYTVDVKREGIYAFEAVVSSGNTNSAIALSLNDGKTLTALTNDIVVPCPEADNWGHYESVEGQLLIPLQAGRQVIRMTITGGWCNIDKIRFTHVKGTASADLNNDGVVDIVDVARLIEIIKNNK